MTAEETYRRAYQNGLELIGTCSQLPQAQQDEIWKNAKMASKKSVFKLIEKHDPNMAPAFYKLWNPYQQYRSDTHIIFVHSAIDHFYKIKDGND